MNAPLWSTVTLATELFVTASVYFIVWRAYRTGVFPRMFAFGVLAYEAVFNVSYMFSREVAEQSAAVYDPYETALAIFHGIFSLLMFVALIVFFLAAARAYRRGDNFFLRHRRLTIVFVIAWGTSILSGVSLFLSLYVL